MNDEEKSKGIVAWQKKWDQFIASRLVKDLKRKN
jgi:hypothetical protein